MAEDSNATEVVTLYLKDGVDLDDSGSSAYLIWQSMMDTTSQQPGFQSLHFGPEIEDPTIVQMLIDWDSVASHRDFMSSPGYSLFTQKLAPILAKPPVIHHVICTPSPCTFISTSPVTEVATFSSISPSFEGNVSRFLSGSKIASFDGFVASTFGSVVGETERSSAEGARVAKDLMLFIGWESKEVHMRFRETEGFRDYIKYLREGVKTAEMHHTIFRPY